MRTEKKDDAQERLAHVTARVRHKQLESALLGHIQDSARYARWAQRVRNAAYGFAENSYFAKRPGRESGASQANHSVSRGST